MVTLSYSNAHCSTGCNIYMCVCVCECVRPRACFVLKERKKMNFEVKKLFCKNIFSFFDQMMKMASRIILGFSLHSLSRNHCKKFARFWVLFKPLSRFILISLYTVITKTLTPSLHLLSLWRHLLPTCQPCCVSLCLCVCVFV